MLRRYTPALSLLGVLLLSSPCRANLFEVQPGPGTPLQDAINAAEPGDTIKLGDGVFTESIVIDKPLKIFGRVHKKTPLAEINAGCQAPIAIDVAADNVNLRQLTVTGGTFSAVQIHNRQNVRVQKVIPQALGAGSGEGCGSEQYGFDIAASERVKLFYGSVAGTSFGLPGSVGFLGAAIYLHQIAPKARVEVIKYFLDGHVRGIVVDGVTGPFAVKLNRFFVIASDTGVLLTNSDDVRVERGFVRTAGTGVPPFGIRVDATSDHNQLFFNQVTGYATDVTDDGSDNCWRRTTFTTGSVATDCS